MNYHKKEVLSNQKNLGALAISQGYCWQVITMVLHNGVMNADGFISITMSEFNTQHSSDRAKSYEHINDLIKKVHESGYRMNLQDIIDKYESLVKLRKEKNLPEATSLH